MISSVLLAALPAVACPLPQAEYNDIWARSRGTSRIDALYAVDADGAGGAILGGSSCGSLFAPTNGQIDAVLRRVDAAGFDMWALQFGTSSSELVADVAVDDFGNVFVVGWTSGTLGSAALGDVDAFVGRYDLNGNRIWLVQIGTAEQDIGRSVMADGLGGCFVAGATDGDFGGPSAGGSDLFVAHIDGTGATTGLTQFGSSSNDEFAELASDDAGGFFLSALVRASLGGPFGGLDDAFLGRFDGTGALLWSTQLGSSEREGVPTIAADGAGGVYIAGNTEGSLAGPSAGGSDRYVGHFDSAGNQIFLEQSGTADRETVNDIAWDSVNDRAVIIGNRTDNPQMDDDAYLWAYTPSGSLVSLRNFGAVGRDLPTGISERGVGGLLVVGLAFGSYGGAHQGFGDQLIVRFEEVVGTQLCSPAVLNSSGLPGRMRVSGSTTASNNNIHLFVDQLPGAATTLFLNSKTPGVVPMAGGSTGTLCLSGDIGRYNGPSQIKLSSAEGVADLLIDLTLTPQPAGSVGVMAGESWHFQAWFRDLTTGGTSNFTDSVVVTF